MKRTVTFTACILLVMIMVFTGCGGSSKENLNNAVDQINENLESTKSVLGDQMDIAVTAEGDNTIVLTYKFLLDTDDTTKDQLTQSIESQTSLFDSLLLIMEQAKIKSPALKILILDSAGAELYNNTFS